MYRIMIVEDDITIASLLQESLQKWGFEAFYVKDLTNVSGEFSGQEIHCVLMDISLPFYNGYYWCSELRKISKVPILFLSSKTDNMDIIMAINMGGDDFITKPFSMEVVIAKIQAILRRTYSYYQETSHLELRGVLLNLNEAALFYHGEKIDLTKNEFRILRLLIEHKNNIVSRELIMKRLWDDESFIDDNTLTVNIARLRKKLENCGLLEFIETKKGLGYLVRD